MKPKFEIKDSTISYYDEKGKLIGTDTTTLLTKEENQDLLIELNKMSTHE